MSAAVQSVPVSGALFHEATRRAEQLGITTQQWICIALEERMRVEEQDSAVWRERAARATGRRLTDILQTSNDNPPDSGDELMDGAH